jgi:hypothetical protein
MMKTTIADSDLRSHAGFQCHCQDDADRLDTRFPILDFRLLIAFVKGHRRRLPRPIVDHLSRNTALARSAGAIRLFHLGYLLSRKNCPRTSGRPSRKAPVPVITPVFQHGDEVCGGIHSECGEYFPSDSVIGFVDLHSQSRALLAKVSRWMVPPIIRDQAALTSGVSPATP